MFNKDFYPTPDHVINQMLFGLDLDAENVLEPSAGKGDIVKKCQEYGAKVFACEINNDLAKIVSNIADSFLGSDFLQLSKADVSHIDYIIMNPPFSADEKHIMHAWEIAPDGCEIIALCNYETIHNPYSRSRKVLSKVIKNHGTSESLGDCFASAERKTGANIGLIKLFKPKVDNDFEFEGYFDMSEEYESQSNGLMSYDAIREIVNRYVGAVKRFDDVMRASEEINELTKPLREGKGTSILFGAYRQSENNYTAISRDVFKKDLQKQAWWSVFRKLNMERFVTSSVMEEINKFVETHENVPFTVKNVYKMLGVIAGTREQTMNKVIVQVFDQLTKHSHENRYQLEGWKTNSEYRVNKKFIINWGCTTMDFSGKMRASYSGRSYEIMDDLTKAICFITGKKYDEMESFWKICQELDFGKWYDFNFFRFKGYKKGTTHVEFKDEKIWEQFNIAACKSKGFQLASKYTSDFRQKSNGVEIYK
jgi:predicted RNA methylase